MAPHSSHIPNGSPHPQSDKESFFFSLLEQYQDKLFRYVYFRLNDREVALDIVQDTFTKTWKYLASGKTIDYEEAFLYRITKNAIIDFFKKKKALSLDFLEEKGFDAEGMDARETVEKNSELAYIHDLIKGLNEDEQQLIMLRYGDERTLEDIAALYKRTPNAIAVRLHRIMNKLKENYH